MNVIKTRTQSSVAWSTSQVPSTANGNFPCSLMWRAEKAHTPTIGGAQINTQAFAK